MRVKAFVRKYFFLSFAACCKLENQGGGRGLVVTFETLDSSAPGSNPPPADSLLCVGFGSVVTFEALNLCPGN